MDSTNCQKCEDGFGLAIENSLSVCKQIVIPADCEAVHNISPFECIRCK